MTEALGYRTYAAQGGDWVNYYFIMSVNTAS